MHQQRQIMSEVATATAKKRGIPRGSRARQLDPVMGQDVALPRATGLSIAVVELLARVDGAKRKTYWWSKFWAAISARCGHWLWRGPEFLDLGDRQLRVRDVAYVYARGELDAGETTKPVCGHSDCVKHLRVVAVHQRAA